MKNLITTLIALIIFLPTTLCAKPLAAQGVEPTVEPTVESDDTPFTINHGPYLQGLGYDRVTICFTTSHEGFSKVELREKGSTEVSEHRTSEHGLFMANNTHNVIKIDGLKPATEYEYRIVSKHITRCDPYHVRFGAEVESEWYDFRTFNPKATEFTFVVANDIHDDAEKCGKMLDVQPMDEVEMVFYNGDIMSHYSKEGQPFNSFIDISVEKFAKHKPFAVVRGNHETRGHLARSYDEFIHNTPEGKYYGVYYFGNTAIVMLDGGEDKDDQHPVYAGLVDFDNYRIEQAEWLKGVVKSKAFRSAEHRIVIIHIPPVTERMMEVEENAKDIKNLLTWRGGRHLGELMIPILNEADINVMLCGHLHRHVIYPVQHGVLEFPIIANDNVSSMLVHTDAGGVHVKIVHIDGHTTFEKSY